MPVWLALAAAYAVGSVDFAVVVARSRGVDIRQVGSGNPGTSNVLRTLGRGPAAMVLIGDSMKGVLAASFGWLASSGGNPVTESLAYVAALCAVIGHAFPVFHRFKGGKGVATAGGAMLFIMPIMGIGLAAVWILVARVTKVASIASLVVVALTMPAAYVAGARGAALAWLAAIVALVIWRHTPNIQRMIRGSEKKVPT